MKKNILYSDLLGNTASAIGVLEENPEITLKGMTLNGAQKAHQALSAGAAEADKLEEQLTAKIAEIEDAAKKLRTFVSRVRSGVRAHHGPDSPEYAKLGCIRTSDRKRPSRRTNGNVVTNANGNGNGTATANGNGNGNGAAAEHVQN